MRHEANGPATTMTAVAIVDEDPARQGQAGHTRFEPVAVEPLYRQPSATIHPDRALGWLRRLWPLVMAHRWLLITALVPALVSMLLQVAIPAVIRSAIDQALTEQTQPLGYYVGWVVALGLGRALLVFTFRHSLYRLAFEIDFDLRVLLYDHLSRLSFSYYDRTQSGQVISRANSDIRSVQVFLAFAPIISMTMVMFATAVTFMASIHLWLTLAALVPLPGVYVLGKQLRNDVFPLSWIQQGRVADVASLVDENINGVRVVRSFGAEQAQLNDLADSATRLRWAGLRTIQARSRFNPFIENLPRIGTLVVLVYGGWLVIEGEISEGTLFAFTSYVLLLQVPFRTLGMFLMFGQRARASALRIYEILDEAPDIEDRPDAADLDTVQGRVQFNDVKFSYGAVGPHDEDAALLDGFSMDVHPGETVAVVGATGSGKSTVARLLARYYEVDSGAVCVDGHDVRDVTQVSLRHHVGIVTEEPFLFSVSLADNIAYGRPDASRAEIEQVARSASAHDFITALPNGYETVVGERGYTLSGGQRQRVALARMLLSNPRIVVLDDATSAIDVRTEHQIHTELGRLLPDRTTIVVGHRLSTIALADRVVLIMDGRAVDTGTHQDMLATNTHYRDILAGYDPERERDDDRQSP